MSKDAYWFKHDSNASRDLKLMQIKAIYGLEGLGIFWSIIEVLREQREYCWEEGKVDILAKIIDCDEEKLIRFLSDCRKIEVFCFENGVFYSNRLCRDMNVWETKKANRSKKKTELERNWNGIETKTEDKRRGEKRRVYKKEKEKEEKKEKKEKEEKEETGIEIKNSEKPKKVASIKPKTEKGTDGGVEVDISGYDFPVSEELLKIWAKWKQYRLLEHGLTYGRYSEMALLKKLSIKPLNAVLADIEYSMSIQAKNIHQEKKKDGGGQSGGEQGLTYNRKKL
jgi:hypothetical protein